MWHKELIFTNQVTGIATVYIHMGYGNISSIGEFTNISLEEIDGVRSLEPDYSIGELTLSTHLFKKVGSGTNYLNSLHLFITLL